MAIVAINLKDYPVLQSQLSVEVGPLPNDLHITLLYLGENANSIILDVVEAVSKACASMDSSFDATVSSVGYFPSVSEKPVILPVESPGLHDLRERITKHLDAHKVRYPKDWANFSPHITVDWSMERPERFSITPKTFHISSVEIWPENDGDRNKLVFSIGPCANRYGTLSESIHTVNKGITRMDDSSKKLDALAVKLKLQKALTSNIVSGWAKRAMLAEQAASVVEGTEQGYKIYHIGSLDGTPVQDPTQPTPTPHSSFRPVESTPPVVSIQKSFEATQDCRACGYVYKSILGACPRCDRTEESKNLWDR